MTCNLCDHVFVDVLQRWAHLTTPVWGAHHLEYMAPDIKSLSSMSPGIDDNKVIIFESVM